MKKVRAGNVNMEFICIMENAQKAQKAGHDPKRLYKTI